MENKLKKLQDSFVKQLKKVGTLNVLEELEQDFFARKTGKMSLVMKEMKDLSEDMRKEVGKTANEIKQIMVGGIEEKKQELKRKKWDDVAKAEKIDVTQPLVPRREQGNIHTITQAMWHMEDVAKRMGFMVEDGPELDSDYYCFEALNIPAYHPAGDSQDTFYIKGNEKMCMRPHVSNMQVRLLKKYGAPLRIAYPGRVYRNEALDSTHEHTFEQFEAFVVDKNITVGHLIGVMKELISGFYGKEMDVRLRPGYFPFVEPGFELDIKYTDVNGNEKWMEMLGCGLMHPNVIREAGLDPAEYQGLAFGIGFDRLVMLKYHIEDIRHLRSGDLRFLKQF